MTEANLRAGDDLMPHDPTRPEPTQALAEMAAKAMRDRTERPLVVRPPARPAPTEFEAGTHGQPAGYWPLSGVERVAPSEDSGRIDLSTLRRSQDSGVDTLAPVVNHPPFSRLMAHLRLKRIASPLIALAVVGGLMTLDSRFARTPHLESRATPKNGPAAAPRSTAVDSDTTILAPDLAASPSNILELAPPARVQPAKPESAVGGSLDVVRSVADETPAALGARGDIPEAPPQGAIQGALGTQRQATRACLEGQTAPSRATVVFASAGHVESVTIAGSATGSPADACIRAALSKIAVGPFRRPRFAVTTTITPP